jgi:hypothetical protein
MAEYVFFRGRQVRAIHFWSAAAFVGALIGIPVPAFALMSVLASVASPVLLVIPAAAVVGAALVLRRSVHRAAVWVWSATAWWVISGGVLGIVVWLNPATPSTPELARVLIVVVEVILYLLGSAAGGAAILEFARQWFDAPVTRTSRGT